MVTAAAATVGGSMEFGMTRSVSAVEEGIMGVARSLSLEVGGKSKFLRNVRTMRFLLALIMSAIVAMVAVSRLKLLVDPWFSSHHETQQPPLQQLLMSSLSSSNPLSNPPLLTHTGVATGHNSAKNHLSSTELKLVPSPVVAANRPQFLSSIVDSTCTSRGQQEMYRDSAHQFPRSGLLDQALEEYTRMHSHCALYDGDGSSDVKTECRYLVYLEGYEGLGNRLLSLVSAFAYAMVTKRALVIDARRGHLAALLCEPFQDSSWLLPPGFVDEVWGAPNLEDAMHRGFQNVSAVRINLRHEQTRADQRFFCAATQQEGLQNVTWIGWESNQYYVPRLFMIPSFWSLLSPWFPDPSLVFTQLTRFLCLPQNQIWARIQRVHESYLASSMMQVGLQVRRNLNADNATLAESVQELIMNCSLKHHLLPRPAMHNEEPVVVVQQQQLKPPADTGAKSSSSSSSSSRTSAAVLVTSLHMQYYEKLRNLYLEHGTEDGTVVSVHMMSHDGVENDSYEQAVKALMEIWLLSFSNKLATSSWSTFGYVAQGLGGLHPVIFNFLALDLDDHTGPACWLGQSSEPCLHYPFVKQLECGNVPMSKQQSNWIATHIRPCQDEKYGLQLCSGLH